MQMPVRDFLLVHVPAVCCSDRSVASIQSERCIGRSAKFELAISDQTRKDDGEKPMGS